MKTVVLLITLASVATAVPTKLRENIYNFEHDVDNSDLQVREKKSPPHDFNQALSTDHEQEDRVMQNLKQTEVKTSALQKRTPSLIKPIIVKKKIGYHVYRNSEEEMAHANPHENCSKQVKVKLCDTEPVSHTNSDGVMSEHSHGNILEKEMQHSIKLAKEAVENLQRDLWKVEQNSKLSDSKEKIQLESELQQDVESARKVLEHIQQKIGNFESIEATTDSPKAETIQRIDSKDAERLNQWKEAIENIHKNFEIAKNIEDAFKNEEEIIHSTNTDMKKPEETDHLVLPEENKQKSSEVGAVQTVHNFHKTNRPLSPLTHQEKSDEYRHSSQAKTLDKKYEDTDEKHSADMFVAPTNHMESKRKLHSESLINENVFKEPTKNYETKERVSHASDHFKNSEVLPNLYEIEQMSHNDKQNPIVRAANNYELKAKRENFDNTDFELQLENEGLNENQQFNINSQDININTPQMKTSVLTEDQVNAATDVQLNKKALTEVQTDSETIKETLGDEYHKNSGKQSSSINSDLETLNQNDEAKNMKASDLSHQATVDNTKSETTMKQKDSDVRDQLEEVFTSKASQLEQEEFQKQSLLNKETILDGNANKPNERFLENRMTLGQDTQDSVQHEQHVNVESSLKDSNLVLKSITNKNKEVQDHTEHDEHPIKKLQVEKPSDRNLARNKVQDEPKSISNPDEEIIHSPIHTINEHLNTHMEKSNNVGLQPHKNHGLENSMAMQLTRPQLFSHHPIDHASRFLKTAPEAQNSNDGLTMRWGQQRRNSDHLSQAVQEAQNMHLMKIPMKPTDFDKQSVLKEKMIMRNTEDHNLLRKLNENSEMQGTHLMQQFKEASNFNNGGLMSDAMKSVRFHNEMPTMREQINLQMPQNLGQQKMDSREVYHAPSMRWAQDNAPRDHSMHLLNGADEFNGDHLMHEHLSHEITPTNRFSNNFDAEISHDYMSKMPSHMHMMKHAQSSDMDNSMQPSTQFGVKDSQWGLHQHGMARTGYYPSSSSGGSPGAVGVFPNANTGCGIPLLLSCSPSVVSGSLAKPHPSPSPSPLPSSISSPAYRSGDDFSYYMKRHANHFDRLSNTKVLKSTQHNHINELVLNKAE